MFAKLLKHEFAYNRRLLGLLTGAILGIGIMATVILRVVCNYMGDVMDGNNFLLQMAMIGMTATLFFSAVALCLYMVAVQLVLMYRFYKNKFTDEGYLTFTLPVSTKAIYWSSFLNMFIWLAISSVVVVAIVTVALLFGTATDGLVNTGIFDAVSKFILELQEIPWDLVMEMEYAGQAIAIMVIYILTLLVTPFYTLMLPMACITAGAVLAKKHKILAAIGVYYGVNMVVGIAGSMMSILPTIFLNFGTADTSFTYMVVTTAINLLLTVGLTLGSYFTTTYLMKHKLNLP